MSLAMAASLSDRELARIRDWFREAFGVSDNRLKSPLVAGRLDRRLRALGFTSYEAYLDEILSGRNPAEHERAVDLLTTHETRFFREPAHYAVLKRLVREGLGGRERFRAWSAACSSGEEAWSLAMTLADAGVGSWEVLGSDVSRGVLEKAAAGVYPMKLAGHIPLETLREHCLRGVGASAGTFAMAPSIAAHVRFEQVNLNAALPDGGPFHAIFLRNVMIYFDPRTKARVVERVLQRLQPGGCIFVGHTETLNGVVRGLEPVAPAVYRKPA